MTELIALDEAAKQLGVPKASLRAAAEQHGFIVRMGRAIRIERNRLGDLIKKCRDPQKAHDSSNTSTGRNTTSRTPVDSQAQRVAQAAQKLKKRSRHTSPQKGGKVLQMSRET
jgi:hypothetical protein